MPHRSRRRELAGVSRPAPIRGGSFQDHPHRARSAFRLAYPERSGVFNVGFRVVCLEGSRSTLNWRGPGLIRGTRLGQPFPRPCRLAKAE